MEVELKRIFQYLNYGAIAFLIVGFALLQSYGKNFVPGIALLVAGIATFVIYFSMNINRFREKSTRMNFIFASNIFVILLLTIAILAAVNYLGTRIHKRYDFSEGKIHSLSDQSVRITKNLRKDLNIRGFFTRENPSSYTFKSLMEIYSYYSDKIKFETIDPDKNPSAVKAYNITSDGTVIIGYGKKETRIEQISEESITNAIIQVTRDTRKVVYFIQGHGEPDPAQEGENGFSEVKNNLEKLSYRVKKLVLLQETAIPEDASVLVIAGPQQPLFKKELGMIQEFINHQNGQVFFMLNPGEGEELKPLLKKLGIRIEDDVIVDTVSTVMGGDYFIPVVAHYPDHAITRNFNYATFFPLTRSLSRVSPPPGDVSVTFVASTSPNSWGEQQYAKEIRTDKIVKNPEDKAGPLDIIAAIELKKDGDKTSRVAVSGDSDFVINKYYYFSANGNLFSNIISWLADEGDLVAISARTATPSMLTLTRSDSQLLFYYTMIILPLLVFMVGIGVWLYRRKL